MDCSICKCPKPQLYSIKNFEGFAPVCSMICATTALIGAGVFQLGSRDLFWNMMSYFDIRDIVQIAVMIDNHNKDDLNQIIEWLTDVKTALKQVEKIFEITLESFLDQLYVASLYSNSKKLSNALIRNRIVSKKALSVNIENKSVIYVFSKCLQLNFEGIVYYLLKTQTVLYDANDLFSYTVKKDFVFVFYYLMDTFETLKQTLPYAIKTATKHEKVKILEVILQNFDLKIPIYISEPLSIASYNGNMDIVKVLLKYIIVTPGDKYFERALLNAMNMGHIEIVELLLKDVRINPLQNVPKIIFETISHNQLDVLKLLLQDERVISNLSVKDARDFYIFTKNNDDIQILLNDFIIMKSSDAESEKKKLKIKIKY